MKSLETKLNSPSQNQEYIQTNQCIRTQYAHSILDHKQRLENQQVVTNLHNLP
jgi:hypothetical protein